MPGFIVSTQKESNAICEAVGAPNMKMQMDLYHMQVMEGDLATSLNALRPSAATFRLPDVRSERAGYG